MSKTVYVTFKVELEDDADVDECISEMDYTMTHPAILDTELIEAEERS